MAKKYELVADATIQWAGRTLFRIRALVSFGNVKAGDLGGFVESEKNLDQEVSGDAWVYGDARVSGDAWVYGNARVYGDAWVYGNARVYGDAWVSGDAAIAWASKVSGGNGTLTAFVGADASLIVTRGCFIGTADEFIAAVEKRHGGTQIQQEYRLLIEFFRLRLCAALAAAATDAAA